MNKLLLGGFAVTLPLLLSACASKAVVDTYGDKNVQYLEQDRLECQQIAEQGADGAALSGAKGAAVGGLLGAGTGAAVGAIAGGGSGAAKGAAIGGVLGVVGGGAQQAFSGQSEKDRIYKNCLRNRGHNVLD
jgi:hypothetical protein